MNNEITDKEKELIEKIRVCRNSWGFIKRTIIKGKVNGALKQYDSDLSDEERAVAKALKEYML